jgi:hypothetical protein
LRYWDVGSAEYFSFLNVLLVAAFPKGPARFETAERKELLESTGSGRSFVKNIPVYQVSLPSVLYLALG